MHAARLERQCLDTVRVAAQFDRARTLRPLATEIPDDDALSRARCEIAAVAAPRRLRDLAGIAAHLRIARAGEIPEVHRAILHAARQELAVRTERHRQRGAIPLQTAARRRARIEAMQDDATMHGCAEITAWLVPGERGDTARGGRQFVQLLARRVPDRDGLAGRGREALAVGCPGQVLSPRGRRTQPTLQRAGGRVPEVQRAVLPAAREQMSVDARRARLPRDGQRAHAVLPDRAGRESVCGQVREHDLALAARDRELRAARRPGDVDDVVIEARARTRFEKALRTHRPALTRDRSGSRLRVPADRDCDR